MYNPTSIDRNILNQKWFRNLDFIHKNMMVYLWIKCDSIGVFAWDSYIFCKDWTDSFLNESDIDIGYFEDACNADGKRRIVFLEEDRMIWFTPTITFKHAKNTGHRTFTSFDRDVGIIKNLASRSITREWFINEIQAKSSRITVNKSLLEKVSMYSKPNDQERQFVYDIADVLGFKLKGVKHPDLEMKEEFGHQCQYCSEIFHEFDLEIDHIQPRAKGGKDYQYNKIPACKKCNASKGDNNVFVWMDKMGFEWLPGLKNKVQNLVKKHGLNAPNDWASDWGNKKKSKKEKSYTFSQVQNFVLSNPGLTTSDYECINPGDIKEERRWRRKEL